MIGFVLTAVIISVAATHSVPQYRTDYEYNFNTNAFYKLHTQPLLHVWAENTCESEGASVMQPLPQDILQARDMLTRFPELEDHVWVGDYPTGYGSVEEEGLKEVSEPSFGQIPNPWTGLNQPVTVESYCNAMTRDGEIRRFNCITSMPFICKVEAENVHYDPQCKVFSKDYQYHEVVGSCYKFSKKVAYPWKQALEDCQAEGAHLIILNSELEHQLIHNLLQFARTYILAQTSNSWYAGIRAEISYDGSPAVFKTVLGQTLQEAGFDQWSENESNIADSNKYCGSIFKEDGKYSALQCSQFYGFICEKEVLIEK